MRLWLGDHQEVAGQPAKCARGPGTFAAAALLTVGQIQAATEDMERNTTPQNRTPEMLDMYAGKDIDEKGDIWVRVPRRRAVSNARRPSAAFCTFW